MTKHVMCMKSLVRRPALLVRRGPARLCINPRALDRKCCSLQYEDSRLMLRVILLHTLLRLDKKIYDMLFLTDRRPHEQRSAAIRAWRETIVRSSDASHVDSTRGEQSQMEGFRNLLIVDNTFGGLSNRRQSLMLAAAAAKLMR